MMVRLGMSLLSAMLLIIFGGYPSNLATDLPRVTNVSIPAYPPIAVAEKVSGAVLVDVQVDVGGRVAEADVISGPESLRDAAKKAALRWRFEPVVESLGTRSVRLTFIFHEPSYIAPKKRPQFTSPYQVEVEWIAAVDCFDNC
jgi:TonB family protein